MVSRRRALQLGAAAFAAAAGCLDRTRSDGTTPTDTGETADTPGEGTTPGATPTADDATPTAAEHDAPTRTPGDVPEWEPEWTMSFEGWRVLGLAAADGVVYATLDSTDGPAAVAAVEPGGQSVRWQSESEGEAVPGSHVSDRGNARGQWGVTVVDETVYTVAGLVRGREWSAIHALDRETGERRWSVRRERELAVAGVRDGVVVATGLEFFPPPGETPLPTHGTPDEPLATAVYGLDPGDGTVRWTETFLDVEEVAVGDGVYVAAGDRLVGLGPDGARRFTYDRGPATSVEAAEEGVFYLTGEDDTATIHRLGPNGDRGWTLEVPVGELLLDGSRLYAGGDAVVAVESDGAVTWRDRAHGRWLLVDPDRDTLYTRSGTRADAASAYDAADGKRWTFDPPSNNAWPEAATQDALMVTSITGGQQFNTVYAVDADGHARAARGVDHVVDALGTDGTVYVANGDSALLALEP